MNVKPGTLCLLLALAAGAAYADKSVARKDLPPAVEKTVARELEGATLKGIAVETCAGKTCYEVETMRGTKTRDLIVDSAGSVVEVEEQMEIADLPEAVKTAAGKFGSIATAERLTMSGAVTYEVVTKKGSSESEHVFLQDGTVKGK